MKNFVYESDQGNVWRHLWKDLNFLTNDSPKTSEISEKNENGRSKLDIYILVC
jgi:hypothetical protein